MGNATASHGATVNFKQLKLGNYVQVAELTDFTPPPISVADIDTSNHDDTWETMIAGRVIRTGELPMELCWRPGVEDGHTTLRTAMIGRGIHRWAVRVSADERMYFDGYIKSLTPTTPFDEKVMASIVVRVSGEIEFNLSGKVTLDSYEPSTGDTLTAALTDESGQPAAGDIVWAWQRKTARGNWVIIAGEVAITYDAVAADVGAQLRARATYDDLISGEQEVVYSPATKPSVV